MTSYPKAPATAPSLLKWHLPLPEVYLREASKDSSPYIVVKNESEAGRNRCVCSLNLPGSAVSTFEGKRWEWAEDNTLGVCLVIKLSTMKKTQKNGLTGLSPTSTRHSFGLNSTTLSCLEPEGQNGGWEWKSGFSKARWGMLCQEGKKRRKEARGSGAPPLSNQILQGFLSFYKATEGILRCTPAFMKHYYTSPPPTPKFLLIFSIWPILLLTIKEIHTLWKHQAMRDLRVSADTKFILHN